MTIASEPVNPSQRPPQGPPQAPPQRPRLLSPGSLLHFALLALILGAAAGLRFAWIDRPSYEMDEFWHVELATGRGSAHMHIPRDVIITPPALTTLQNAPRWYAVWTNMEYVTHPPLYPQLLRLWGGVFGFGDVALRSFSAVVSVVSVLVLFDIARHLHGEKIALWAAALMAAASTQITMSQQVRGYSLLVLMALLACAALVRIQVLGPTWTRYFALTIFTAATVLTHYFGIGAATAMGIYAALRLRGSARRNVAIAFAAAAALFLVVWGPFAWRQIPLVSVTADHWLRDTTPGALLRRLGQLAALPLRLLFEPQDRSYPVAYFAASLYLIPLLMLRRRPELLLWVLWIAGTIGLVATLDFTRGTRHLELVRYTFLASPAIYMILITLLSHQKNWLRHAVPAMCVVCSVLALQAAYSMMKPDWKGAAAYLDRFASPQDIVVFYGADNVDWFDRMLLLGITHYRREPSRIVLLSGPAQPALLQELRSAPAVWLVSRSTLSPEHLLPGAFAASEVFMPDLGTCRRIYFPETVAELRTTPSRPK